MKIVLRSLIAIPLLLLPLSAPCQQPPDPPPPAEAPEVPEAPAAPAYGDFAGDASVEPAPGRLGRNWTAVEIALSVGTLFFAIVVLGLETIIILKAQKPWAPQEILRVFGLTLILAMSVLLIAAGYSKDQTAPVMGLLGVIAGYLLGHNEKPGV